MLEEDFDVIMYDRRWHGLSDAPEKGYSFRDHAADLASLIDVLGMVRPCVIGHSGGAASAAIVAAEHPDLLSYLILEDSPWGRGWGEWESISIGMKQHFRDVRSKTREELVTSRCESSTDWTEDDVSF